MTNLVKGSCLAGLRKRARAQKLLYARTKHRGPLPQTLYDSWRRRRSTLDRSAPTVGLLPPAPTPGTSSTAWLVGPHGPACSVSFARGHRLAHASGGLALMRGLRWGRPDLAQLVSVLSRNVVKLRTKGKSFKWGRRRRHLLLKYGRSHLAVVRRPTHARAKKLGRLKMVFAGPSRTELRRFVASAISWRPINIYNARGLRFARMAVPRKHGKVSAYR